MATTGHSCFWLVDFWQSFSLELLSQMNRNLVGSTYGRFCIKFPQSRMKGERHRLSPLLWKYILQRFPLFFISQIETQLELSTLYFYCYKILTAFDKLKIISDLWLQLLLYFKLDELSLSSIISSTWRSVLIVFSIIWVRQSDFFQQMICYL